MSTDSGQSPLWWQTGVVYQIYPRSFADANGDGVGDLDGIRTNLDHLAWLGVDAIWIAPFYRSPMADFGYDVSDHTDVDPLFGDMAAFDALLAAAHERGLQVVVDYVPNHVSDRHPWFVESRSSRDSAKRDWFFWRDPGPAGEPPNNWLSMFGGPAWEWDAASEQFYLHSFLAAQPDINWRNPDAREAMLDVARFWLDRGVDGFRIDVATFVGKDPQLQDNPPNPAPAGGAHLGAWKQQLHLYDHSHPDVHGIYRDFRRLVDSYGAEQPRVTIGELHHPDFEIWAGYYGEDLDEIHLPFNFHLIRAPWDAVSVRAVVDGIEAALPRGAWPNWVLGNHDQARLASRIGREQARVAMLLLLALRGAPTIYYGEEICMVNVPVPTAASHDPWERNEPGQGRDPERTPMQWDASANAGFCASDVTPWLPLAADAETVNVAAQTDDPASMLTLTRRLLSLRRDHPALALGGYRSVDDVPDGCFAFLRQTDDAEVLVVLNFTAESLFVPLNGRSGVVLIGTQLDRDGAVLSGPSLELRSNEALVLDLAVTPR